MTRFIAEFSRYVSLVLLKLEVNGKCMGNRSRSGNNHEKTNISEKENQPFTSRLTAEHRQEHVTSHFCSTHKSTLTEKWVSNWHKRTKANVPWVCYRWHSCKKMHSTFASLYISSVDVNIFRVTQEIFSAGVFHIQQLLFYRSTADTW